MSNNVNDVFVDVLVTLDQFIGKYFNNAYRDYTPNGYAQVSIDWNPSYSRCNRFSEPFLDSDSEGHWDITLDARNIYSTVTSVHPDYASYSRQWRLRGMTTNSRWVSSPGAKSGLRPLEDFYPQLKDIIQGIEPKDFALFTASLAFALNRTRGTSVREFLQRWEAVVATQDITYLHTNN